MSPDRWPAQRQLTPEEEAQIDAICDRFERAWQGVAGGGPTPSAADSLGDRQGPQREALLQELVALELACQQRYRPAASFDTPERLDPRPEAAGISLTGLSPVRPTVHSNQPADWPAIPGLELMEVVGSGGMGVVFKARHATLEGIVGV